MIRTEGANNVNNLFSNGPPGTSLEENWLNSVQEEICYVIEQAGLTVQTRGTDTRQQLYNAINAIYDDNIVSDTLEVKGTVDVSWDVQGVSVAGKIAYVASLGRLSCVDVSRPTLPALLGSLVDGDLGAACGIVVSGRYAYIGNYSLVLPLDYKFVIVDISDPTSPTKLGTINSTQVGFSELEVFGKYVCGAAGCGNRVTLIDVSDPNNPFIAGTVQDHVNLKEPFGISVKGNYAYVACHAGNSLTCVDISDPTSPSKSGQVIDGTNLGGAAGVDVIGSIAYVACLDGVVACVDVSDPTTPVVLGQVIDPDKLAGGENMQIKVKGDKAYVAVNAKDSITVVDISNPVAPSIAGQLIDTTNLFSVQGLDISGKYLYAGAYGGASPPLTVVEINEFDYTVGRIGSLESDNINVTQDVAARNIRTRNGLNVGGNAIIDGDLTVNKHITLLSMDTSGYSTGGAGEEDMDPYTMPAGTMNDTNIIKIKAAGYKTGVAGNKTIKFYFGASSWTFHVAANDQNDWRLEAEIVNTATNAQRISWLGWNGITPLQGYETAAIDTTAAVIIKLTGNCVDGVDTINLAMFSVEMVRNN